jgi:hypothetical protein
MFRELLRLNPSGCTVGIDVTEPMLARAPQSRGNRPRRLLGATGRRCLFARPCRGQLRPSH